MSAVTEPYARRWQALIVLTVSLLVVTIDNTILNVALPTIGEELDASSSELQWIVDGYLLLFAGLLLAAGSLGDRFGRRRALVVGLLTLATGSIFAALADSSGQLIAARALMGIGAAGIMPSTLSIITNIFPPEERPKAIAAWAAVSGIGVAAGPVAGGLLIEHLTWNWIFLVNMPTIAACLVGIGLLVPESREPNSPRLDVVGAGLSIVALTTIVWGLIQAPELGWTDPTILAAFAGGLAIAGVFLLWERRVEHPMLEVSVFRNARFSAASLSITFVFFALMGVMYFLTTYLQSVMGYDALDAGIRTLPIAGGLIVASRPAMALAERLGAKIVVALGLGVVGLSLVMLAGCGVDTGYGRIALTLATMGAGIGLAMPVATEAIMGALPPARAGIGSAMNDVVREVAGTLGVAVLGSVLASAYAGGMDAAVTGLSSGAASTASDSIGGAHEVAAGVGGDAGASLIAAANDAFVDAMSTTSTIAAAIAIVGALIAAAFLPARARSESIRVAGELPEPAAA